MNLSTLPICIVVQRFQDDQRIKRWMELLASKVVAYLVSGENGEHLHLLVDIACLKTIDGSNSLKEYDFPEKVDFVLLHGGDSGSEGDCWSGAKKHLKTFTGPVFLYDSPGTPSIPDNDFRYLAIRRGTKPIFEIIENHVDEILRFVSSGVPVPSCCRERPNVLLAVKLLCQCHEMVTLSESELNNRGIKHTESLKLAAPWFEDLSNWHSILQHDFLLAVENEFGPEGIYPCLLAILNLSLDSVAVGSTDKEKANSKSAADRKDAFAKLVPALSSEIDRELKKYA